MICSLSVCVPINEKSYKNRKKGVRNLILNKNWGIQLRMIRAIDDVLGERRAGTCHDHQLPLCVLMVLSRARPYSPTPCLGVDMNVMAIIGRPIFQCEKRVNS